MRKYAIIKEPIKCNDKELLLKDGQWVDYSM